VLLLILAHRVAGRPYSRVVRASYSCIVIITSRS